VPAGLSLARWPCSGRALATEVTGAGSSFVYPLMSQWSADYSTATGTHINYTSIGSGAGIAQIKAATIDFGASDKPMAPDELAQFGLAQFPDHHRRRGSGRQHRRRRPGQLRLDGDTLAKIFLGTHHALERPGDRGPESRPQAGRRLDLGGAPLRRLRHDFNFVNYLNKVSSDWHGKVGEGTSVQWPVGVGGKGNEGVAAYVKQIKNSIGYVELEYAIKTKMAYAALKNHAGNFVQPSLASFEAAAESANWAGAKDFTLVITDAPGAQAWPITASVFVIVYRQPKDPARSKAAFDFFRWALEKGQVRAKELNYVALPPALVKNIEKYWASEIK
jgi:phosphate transport system substrate-binding protein